MGTSESAVSPCTYAPPSLTFAKDPDRYREMIFIPSLSAMFSITADAKLSTNLTPKASPQSGLDVSLKVLSPDTPLECKELQIF